MVTTCETEKANLSHKQLRITAMISMGFTTKQIALCTGITPGYVRVIRCEIYRKLGFTGHPCAGVMVAVWYVREGCRMSGNA